MFKRKAIIVCSHMFVYDQNSINLAYIRFLPPCLLKALTKFGNCQRPVFSLGESQLAYNNKPVKTLTQLVVIAREEWKKKTPLSHKLCAFRCLNLRPQLRSRTQI